MEHPFEQHSPSTSDPLTEFIQDLPINVVGKGTKSFQITPNTAQKIVDAVLGDRIIQVEPIPGIHFDKLVEHLLRHRRHGETIAFRWGGDKIYVITPWTEQLTLEDGIDSTTSDFKGWDQQVQERVLQTARNKLHPTDGVRELKTAFNENELLAIAEHIIKQGILIRVYHLDPSQPIGLDRIQRFVQNGKAIGHLHPKEEDGHPTLIAFFVPTAQGGHSVKLFPVGTATKNIDLLGFLYRREWRELFDIPLAFMTVPSLLALRRAIRAAASLILASTGNTPPYQ